MQNRPAVADFKRPLKPKKAQQSQSLIWLSSARSGKTSESGSASNRNASDPPNKKEPVRK